MSLADKIVYTGAVDELMNYKLGELGYRSLSFDTKVLNKENFQGIAVINETGADVPYTRTIEHKHFYYNNKSKHTVVTREYPLKWQRGLEPYYAINNEINNNLYKKYSEEIKTKYPKIVLGGRLGEYKYYDMDDAVEKALNLKI